MIIPAVLYKIINRKYKSYLKGNTISQLGMFNYNILYVYAINGQVFNKNNAIRK